MGAHFRLKKNEQIVVTGATKIRVLSTSRSEVEIQLDADDDVEFLACEPVPARVPEAKGLTKSGPGG